MRQSHAPVSKLSWLPTKIKTKSKGKKITKGMVCEICIFKCLNAKFIPLKCIDEINATNQVANNTNCNFSVLMKSVYLKRIQPQKIQVIFPLHSVFVS